MSCKRGRDKHAVPGLKKRSCENLFAVCQLKQKVNEARYGQFRMCASASYCFNLRYSVVFPIPSSRAAASLSPPDSRNARLIARRSVSAVL